MYSYTVLTFNFGNYETVREVEEKDVECEYILVTDNPSLTSKTWKIIYYNNVKYDNFEKALYVRYHPFEFCKTSFVMVIDGSIQIKKSLNKLFNQFKISNKDIFLMSNCIFSSAKQENDIWLKNKKDHGFNKKFYDLNINLLKINKIENQRSNFEAGFKICKNTNITNKFNLWCWNFLENFKINGRMQRLDQTIMTVVSNLTLTENNIMFGCRQIIQNDFMMYCIHGSNKEHKIDICEKNCWFKNKPVTPFLLK